MKVGETFKEFLINLSVKNHETIELRYGEITSALNKKFRDTESKKVNCLQVGSYGRWTAIDGISDLDMLYIMPKGKWQEYNVPGGQSKILDDVKDAIKSRYSSTNIKKDRLVVCVTYNDFHVEVQPVFEQDDGSFKYPDTYSGGKWKITKPREEIRAMKDFNEEKNNNLRRLCKMTRAWKNYHGVGMGGLLIDTLAHNFLRSTNDYNDKSYMYYDHMCRDFFKYLSEEPKKDRYGALGSGQHVKVKKDFRKAAENAYNLSLEAIEASISEDKDANKKWKKIFGRRFPSKVLLVTEAYIAKSLSQYRNTEEFIDDRFPVDVRYNLQLECTVSQNGFQPALLNSFLQRRMPLSIKKDLKFYISDNDTPEPYSIYWKVLNRGPKAKAKDCIRGQIIKDDGKHEKIESTSFSGEHIVECYAVKDNVVVAKGRIDVPISEN
ncbi:SMODS domain-containing nucleotidyltransferase [Comamonas squillarum]|uniref:Nucleotidyltransferase n=1 Tax=Comamonas squillarum TaxID=2977320 RepID=A0ABY6A5Z1_9BURK|nr:nucleotidyltransferase [Comamonas sp. PR12]UXC20369.1 nucleotidyltransferase [Comamonas sp. PR12]